MDKLYTHAEVVAIVEAVKRAALEAIDRAGEEIKKAPEREPFERPI